MIDLHIHSKHSDGTWNVKELLNEAQKSGIEILSITDHDTVEAYKELESIDYKKIFNGKIITGIELNTVYNGIKFELLAYDLDLKKIENWLSHTYETKPLDLNLEFNLMLESCKKNNIKIQDIKYNLNDGWPVDIIFKEIKKYKENKKYFKDNEWNNIGIFFNSCITNKKFPVYFDASIHYPSADIISRVVKEAGGKLFLAHAFRYNLEDTITFLNLLKNDNIINGVEVYHSSFTENQTKILKVYCEKNNLFMSGGSDCHGTRKSEIKIGIGYGNMNVHNSIIKPWYDKNLNKLDFV